ncbi:MAG: iron-sulfur cluster assembly scaffold protein [Xanthomonadales bacterium]|nr:iron-sulfur cluster assembly scaffold protein [Xanthomonadales bacterium]
MSSLQPAVAAQPRASTIADAYRTVVLEHNRAPRRRGRLAVPTLRARGINALCGDCLEVDLEFDGERLRGFAFEAEASALTLAATSIMGDLVVGRPLAEVRALCEAALDLVTRNPGRAENPALGDYNAFLGVLGHPNRIKTVTLPWATLAGARAGRLATSTDIDVRGADAPAPPARSPHE